MLISVSPSIVNAVVLFLGAVPGLRVLYLDATAKKSETVPDEDKPTPQSRNLFASLVFFVLVGVILWGVRSDTPSVSAPPPAAALPQKAEREPTPTVHSGVRISGGVQQTAIGDCPSNIIGSGNTINNNCNAIPKYPVMTERQFADLVDAMRPYHAVRYRIEGFAGSNETKDFPYKLAKALRDSGSEVTLISMNTPAPRGAFAFVSPEAVEAFTELNTFLVASHLVKANIAYRVEQPASGASDMDKPCDVLLRISEPKD
jgi:hypothetical protein